jgi:hypothetical protein
LSVADRSVTSVAGSVSTVAVVSAAATVGASTDRANSSAIPTAVVRLLLVIVHSFLLASPA